MNDIDPIHYDAVELMHRGRLEEAEQAFLRALEANPDDVYIMLDLGCLYQKQKRFALAIDIHRRAIELEPENQQAWYTFGSVLAYQSKFKEAVQVFKRAIELMPDYVFSWEGYAYCLWKSGDVVEAEIAFRKSLELYPESISSYHLAELCFERERYTEAEELVTWVEEDLMFKDAWLLLSKILEKLGREDEAKRAKEKAKMTEVSS